MTARSLRFGHILLVVVAAATQIGLIAVTAFLLIGVPRGNQPMGVGGNALAAQELEAGMCVRSWEPLGAEYEVVGCTEPHAAQLVFRPELVPWLVSDGARFPGELSVTAFVEESCRQAITKGMRFDRDAFPFDAEQLTRPEPPTGTAWRRDETSGWCWIVAPEGGSFEQSYLLGES